MNTPRDSRGSFWRSPGGITFAIFLGVAGFLLVSEHWAHVLGAAPLLLILGACIGMHFFMHGGHGGHEGGGARKSELNKNDTDSGHGGGHGH